MRFSLHRAAQARPELRGMGGYLVHRNTMHARGVMGPAFTIHGRTRSRNAHAHVSIRHSLSLRARCLYAPLGVRLVSIESIWCPPRNWVNIGQRPSDPTIAFGERLQRESQLQRAMRY